MHRLAVTLITLASALSVSRIAHAAIVCGDYLAAEYQPDEMTSTASRDLAESLRACVCEVDCASVCVSYDAEQGNYACGINDALFATQGGDVSACNACMGASCGSLLLACYLDN